MRSGAKKKEQGWGGRLISSSQFWAGEVSIKKKRGEERQKRSMASLDIFRERARLGKQEKSGVASVFLLLYEITQFYWTLLRKFVQRIKKLQKIKFKAPPKPLFKYFFLPLRPFGTKLARLQDQVHFVASENWKVPQTGGDHFLSPTHTMRRYNYF